MVRRTAFIVISLIGCGLLGLNILAASGVSAQDTRVTGTVSYRERIALPAQAVINVQLQDVSRADAPATVLAEQTINAEGKQVPFAFDLPYDSTKIDERYTYAVRAQISVDGQLWFTTTERYPVITQGNPTNVDLVLQRVDSSNPPTDPDSLPATGSITFPTVSLLLLSAGLLAVGAMILRRQSLVKAKDKG